MSTETNVACSSANKYIFAEEIKSERDEFVKTHGICIGKIRGFLKCTKKYLYIPH